MKTFVAAGYTCIDYYPNNNNEWYVTGNGIDVILNLIDLSDNLKYSIVSAVSDDLYGDTAVKLFKKLNIDCSHLDIVAGGETPSVPLSLIKNDRVHGTPNRGVMADYEFSQSAIDYICTKDYMHTDFTGKLISKLPYIKEQGVKIFFDLSNQLDHPDLIDVLQHINVGLVSFESDIEEAKNFLVKATDLGVEIMIATLGNQGSIAYDGKRFYKQPAIPVSQVVNTVGAGDSFFAGFIASFINGMPIEGCLETGAKRASKIISIFRPYLCQIEK